MHKHRGGGTFDSFSQKATQLKNDAVKKSKDMGLHVKASAAHQAAIDHATAAKQMVSDASSQAMAKGMEVHGKMKPQLDLAYGHANDALMHAQNKNTDGFNASMGNFASSMGKAGSAGGDHIMKNTTVGNASLADHASAVSMKAASTAAGLHSNAMKFLGLSSKPASTPVPATAAATTNAAPLPAMGGRRRKSRKHSKNGRRGRRMTKNKGMKKLSYRTRKRGNSKKMFKSRTKK